MRTIIYVIIVSVCVIPTFAQKSKPWTEWSKKDAERILSDSGWSKAQDDTDTSEMTYSPTTPPSAITATASSGNSNRDLSNRGRDESGAKNQALSLKYFVRFFTAKPVREAFARMIVLQQGSMDEQRVNDFSKKMQGWIDVDLGEIVVVSVSIGDTDRRISGPVEQAFRSATSDTLKSTCYLERNDGKRVFLIQYEQPTADQTGAKFVFSRIIDDQPFLTSKNETVRFVVELNDKVKINRKYKIPDMIYNGKLEY
jgi:hypothetical protein